MNRTRYRSDLNILIGRMCNATCSHCSVMSSPDNKLRMSEETLSAVFRLITDFRKWSPHGRVVVTGGEPFLFRQELERIGKFSREADLRVAVETNGYWAKSPDIAMRTLKRSSITDVILSASIFHTPFVSAECVKNAYLAAKSLGLDAWIRMVHNKRKNQIEEDLETWIRGFVQSKDFMVEDVLLSGRNVDMPTELPDEKGGNPMLCPSDGPIILEDGRIDPCCNTLSTLGNNNLSMGNVADACDHLFERIDSDPAYCFIRERGLRAFIERLRSLRYVPKEEWISDETCTVCTDIFSNPDLAEPIAAIREGRLKL